MMQSARNDEGLVRLYGYQQLQQTYGWGRRTLENAMRSGKLRRPMIVGKRACWTASDIDDYLVRLRGDLEALAVDSPADVPEDKIADALQQLNSRLALAMGHKIAPDAVTGFTFRMTDDQVAAAAAVAASNADAATLDFCDMFGRLDTVRALLVVGGLMPVLRPVVDQCLMQMTGQATSQTADELRELAVDIVLQSREGEFVGPSGP